MIKNETIYAIELTREAIENYGDDSTAPSYMAEHLGIDNVMTEFSWEENENRNLILTARILDGVNEGEALAELKDNEYVEKCYPCY